MSQQIIPIIGTAIVNGVNWLQRLIKSVDYPVDKFIIFNNNGKKEFDKHLDILANQDHPYIKEILVCHLPSNIGCPAAWNLIIKSNINAPYWIITNHDVAFTPGFLQEMVEKASDQNTGVVHSGINSEGLGKWDLFLIKDWMIDKYGLFDENFYPAYGEDYDYLSRYMYDNIQIDSVSKPYLHGDSEYSFSGSQTWRTDPSLKDKIDNARILNETEYLDNKWGIGWKDKNPYIHPFNNEQLSNSYTSFNLNFARKKYLGF